MSILADWVKETSATTGTGTITLSGTAVTSFIRFQDSEDIADGERVYYLVEDGDDVERGIGTWTSSGNTLSRDLVTATLVGTTYDTTAPVALTLTGNQTVSIAASKDILKEQSVGATLYSYFNYGGF